MLARTLLLCCAVLLLLSCKPGQDGSRGSDDPIVVNSDAEELTFDLSAPPPAADAGEIPNADDSVDDTEGPTDPPDQGENETSEDIPGCLLECPEGCAFDPEDCSCDCPELDCNSLGMTQCQATDGCKFDTDVCPECCDSGEDDCLCDCEGACVPETCGGFEPCGSVCAIRFTGDGCAHCDCPEPGSCDGHGEYCGCRDDERCQAFVMGPTCGLDCECDGLACGCPSGTFVSCFPKACPVPEPTCPLDRGCEWALDDDGCVECSCETPTHCDELDDYCDCAEEYGCEVIANQDCGFACECLFDELCDCEGTEFLGCQRESCPPILDTCDVESGDCELVYDDHGCARCSCTGDDVCAGLDYCRCEGSPDCEVVSTDCICPCDHECLGYEDCDCDCGGGEYLGCEELD